MKDGNVEFARLEQTCDRVDAIWAILERLVDDTDHRFRRSPDPWGLLRRVISQEMSDVRSVGALRTSRSAELFPVQNSECPSGHRVRGTEVVFSDALNEPQSVRVQGR